MENDLRRGTLHSSEEIEKGIKTMCLNIRAKLLMLPAKLSPRLAQMEGNQAEIFDEMKKAVDPPQAVRDFGDTSLYLVKRLLQTLDPLKGAVRKPHGRVVLPAYLRHGAKIYRALFGLFVLRAVAG